MSAIALMPQRIRKCEDRVSFCVCVLFVYAELRMLLRTGDNRCCIEECLQALVVADVISVLVLAERMIGGLL